MWTVPAFVHINIKDNIYQIGEPLLSRKRKKNKVSFKNCSARQNRRLNYQLYFFLLNKIDVAWYGFVYVVFIITIIPCVILRK